MDALSNELLSDIWTHLSQRNLFTICSLVCKRWNLLISQPYFYSTIHVYTERQFGKLIEIGKKKKKTKNKSINYYVKCIIFHYHLGRGATNYVPLFPKLQRIHVLNNDSSTINFYSMTYSLMNQPSEFYYICNGVSIVKKFNQIKTDLKSLYIYISNEFMTNISYREREQLETIQIQPIGNMIESSGEMYQDLFVNVLVLPTTPLYQLKELKINFAGFLQKKWINNPPFVINELTFENIHQSCPSLASLSVECFYMSLSNEGIINNDSNKIIPAFGLKKITMNGGFHHQLCLSYFITKYPHLESISLGLLYDYLFKERRSILIDSIANMLFQFPLLKELTYHDESGYYEKWPYYEFLQWLNQPSNILTHLHYPFPLTIAKTKQLNEFNNMDKNIRIPLHQHQQLQFNFLNHLTSLSLYLYDIIDLAFTFLTINTNKIIISTILKELKIKERDYEHDAIIYFHDWLDMFPNLILLDINYSGYIINDANFFHRYQKNYINNNSNHINDSDDNGNHLSNQLHQLIETKREQQDHVYYKLKHLKLSKSQLWFKNGLDSSLVKCHQLKTLKLNHIKFINPVASLGRIRLDLSNLYLESLVLNGILCSSPNNVCNDTIITVFIIQEISTGDKRVMKRNKHESYDHHFILKCKYVDVFTCNFSLA
ncbi:unnamed protein product [Cunninghamella blakesleeana]